MPTNPGPISQSEHNTTPAIWVCVAVIMAGTVVGGIALIEWMWPMFWTGVGLFLAGIAAASYVGIMDATSEYAPPSSPQRSDD
ncbi:MAG TPA: hypothetical protein VHW92_03740 [Mycobacteriales bacterium]|nr:hypothetical protein [Mycobacteriales bacterium]